MAGSTDLYDGTYERFSDEVLRAIRGETYGTDIGQNSWITVEEYERFASWLALGPDHHVLEVASGSGGPARRLAERTGCRVVGIDANASGVAAAIELAAQAGLTDRLSFRVADADAALRFADGAFDALLCIDSMNHFLHRAEVLREWARVLRPGGRAVFTDPVVLTGPVTNDELALRSSIGSFLFAPPEVNERLIRQAGLALIDRQDVSENAAQIAGRWRDARQRHQVALLRIEGEERFDGLQRFLDAVHRLTSERRLSRIVYLVEKPGRKSAATAPPSNVATEAGAGAVAGAGDEASAIEVRLLGRHESSVLDLVDPDVFDETIRSDLVKQFFAEPNHLLAVAIRDGVVVGMASAVAHVHPDKPFALFINEVGVSAAHRRQGLGRRLVETLLTQARQLRCREAWVATEVDNTAARALYASLGGAEDPDRAIVYTWPFERAASSG